ncbi:small multidrug efflux protein [Microbacterium sp.]|uniref:small multidrug efflux protein n=1 Tax=Microbacterium sp. TaxID=51671 RepID=UPI0037357550
MSALDTFQDFVAQMPEVLQPVAVALVGAVPFVEGEGAVTVGIIGGIHPLVAGVAAVAGNILCVLVVVLVTAGTRRAIVTRHRARVSAREAVAVGGGTVAVEELEARERSEAATSPRKQKFFRALDKYGVPGVSLLGPLLLPTMFTAATLAGIGISHGRIMFWQTLAIIGWTSIVGALIWVVLQSALGA